MTAIQKLSRALVAPTTLSAVNTVAKRLASSASQAAQDVFAAGAVANSATSSAASPLRAAQGLLAGHKTLLVGGGNLGMAILDKMAEQGASEWVATALPTDNTDALENLAAKHNLNLHIERGDLTMLGAPEALIETTLAKLGDINSVIYTAGMYSGGDMFGAPVNNAFYRKAVAVNCIGLQEVMGAAYDHLQPDARGNQAMIYISSLAGARVINGEARYCASKMYGNAIMEGLRNESMTYNPERGIKFCNIRPSALHGPMAEDPARGFNVKNLLPPGDVAEALLSVYRMSPAGVPFQMDVGSTRYANAPF